MTTQRGVLAKAVAVLVLLSAPSLAQAPRRARAAKAVKASRKPAARALRVCAAKRADEKATPSIEPEWPSSSAPKADLVARR
jgi:hypothetical protein